jgi:hypothetical protein
VTDLQQNIADHVRQIYEIEFDAVGELQRVMV